MVDLMLEVMEVQSVAARVEGVQTAETEVRWVAVGVAEDLATE